MQVHTIQEGKGPGPGFTGSDWTCRVCLHMCSRLQPYTRVEEAHMEPGDPHGPNWKIICLYNPVVFRFHVNSMSSFWKFEAPVGVQMRSTQILLTFFVCSTVFLLEILLTDIRRPSAGKRVIVYRAAERPGTDTAKVSSMMCVFLFFGSLSST